MWPRCRLDSVEMPGLPRLRTCAGASVGSTSHFSRIFRMHHREHFSLTEESVFILFGFGIEAGVMIRIESLGSGCGAKDALIQPSQAARSGVPGPCIIGPVRVGVTIAQDAVTTLDSG